MTREPAAPDTNRLIHEKSPYLLQHAHNPVDWYPWSDEALAKARQEDKPIFLSIGYSTCHWCHVMERESFEDPQIARLINQWFVPIKVDREEHPDLDQVYMQAVTTLTGQGGWPLTVFLTPQLKPFFGGTYFPPEHRWNMAGMKELLPAVAEAWQHKREEVMASAEHLTEALNAALTTPTGTATLDEPLLREAFEQASRAFDPAHGGFGDAPKFPRSPALSFLLRYGARAHTPQALDMVTTTLEHLARGGIHDHLGGGFHRYATDASWLVPHFEKMLYDQALLARAYVEAYRITKRADDAEVARDIFAYVLRDLGDPHGAWYAAEDADSEGEEGKFYVWTPAQITAVLGPEEGEPFCRFYGVTPEGNFEHGTSILHIEQPLDAFAKATGMDPALLARRLATARERLRATRAARVRPHRDDKILTSWNGLMIAALADGAAALDEPRYAAQAARAADFLLTHVVRDGVLLRRYRDGDARYPGTLEDYAFLADGLIALYEATFEPRWLTEATRLAHEMLARFWDEPGGGFWLRSAAQPPLIVRAKEVDDGATPSGNAVAVGVLLRLSRLTGEAELESRARRALETFAPLLQRTPFGSPQMLSAVEFALGPGTEVVIAGRPEAPETIAMLRALRERFLPRTVVILHPDGPEAAPIEALIPAIAAQRALNGRTTAYVCERFTCRLPVTTVEELVAQVGG